MRAGGQVAVTDREGYFVLTVPDDGRTGWRDVAVTAGDVTVPVAVFVPGPESWLGAISDIDDTVIRTGAWSLPQNLRTTLTGSLDRREVFGDAVGLMAALAGGGTNPVFYVSSSPWNMHAFLVELFTRAGLARGPLFLRDFGFGRGQVVAERTARHKGRWIDRIMAAQPGCGSFWSATRASMMPRSMPMRWRGIRGGWRMSSCDRPGRVRPMRRLSGGCGTWGRGGCGRGFPPSGC